MQDDHDDDDDDRPITNCDSTARACSSRTTSAIKVWC